MSAFLLRFFGLSPSLFLGLEVLFLFFLGDSAASSVIFRFPLAEVVGVLVAVSVGAGVSGAASVPVSFFLGFGARFFLAGEVFSVASSVVVLAGEAGVSLSAVVFLALGVVFLAGEAGVSLSAVVFLASGVVVVFLAVAGVFVSSVVFLALDAAGVFLALVVAAVAVFLPFAAVFFLARGVAAADFLAAAVGPPVEVDFRWAGVVLVSTGPTFS